jgi:hypothetical protein
MWDKIWGDAPLEEHDWWEDIPPFGPV